MSEPLSDLETVELAARRAAQQAFIMDVKFALLALANEIGLIIRERRKAIEP